MYWAQLEIEEYTKYRQMELAIFTGNTEGRNESQIKYERLTENLARRISLSLGFEN